MLDQFRRKLAIAVRCLQETTQQQMRRRAEQHLNEFWGLDPDINELRTANRFVRLGQSRRAAEGFSLNERSALDVHFISSLPVILQSACKAWVDRKPVQIVVAED